MVVRMAALLAVLVAEQDKTNEEDAHGEPRDGDQHLRLGL